MGLDGGSREGCNVSAPNGNGALGGAVSAAEVLQGSHKPSATPRKWQRVLRAFVDGRSLNRWEAARELRDWCLHSTVSELQDRGVRILRKEEKVPGHFGPVRCCRYWLDPESLQHAQTLLGLSMAKEAA